jgi:hypothetical protein
MAQSMDDVPFDLRNLRIILYEYSPQGMRGLETALINTIGQRMSLSKIASQSVSET